MTSPRRSVFVTLVWLAGCVTPPQSEVFYGDLRSKVGAAVHLVGKFGGPGMQADYVIADSQEVYLMGNVDAGGADLRYGSTVDVQGVLKVHQYVAPRSPGDQVAGDYLYIENATVRPVPQAGSTR